MLAASRLAAATNGVAAPTNAAPAASPDANDSVEKELKQLMEADDAAQAEVDDWIKDNQDAAARGAALPAADMQRRIRERFDPVRKAYEDFIRLHPNYAKARVAYGSFLGDLQDDDGAKEQWEKALALNSKDPAVYNNLANLYGHIGPVKKAFEYYAKAIDLNPKEPLYYHNFGTTVYLFRQDAMEYYSINEQQVFDKALDLYNKALKLDPQNFPLASDVAQTYYGIRPLRLDEALRAWTNTLALAHDEIEREGVYLHFARLKLQASRFAEARAHLNAVTNDMYNTLKKRLVRNLDEQQQKVQGTNAPPAREKEE